MQQAALQFLFGFLNVHIFALQFSFLKVPTVISMNSFFNKNINSNKLLYNKYHSSKS